MALINVVQKPLTGRAKQFDGTLESFLDIINARPKSNLTATCRFDATGNFTGLGLAGGSGVSIDLNVGDWVVFPDDATKPPVTMTNATATTSWQVV